jgi:hypothetical protein
MTAEVPAELAAMWPSIDQRGLVPHDLRDGFAARRAVHATVGDHRDDFTLGRAEVASQSCRHDALHPALRLAAAARLRHAPPLTRGTRFLGGRGHGSEVPPSSRR